jgi:hypothetical protein
MMRRRKRRGDFDDDDVMSCMMNFFERTYPQVLSSRSLALPKRMGGIIRSHIKKSKL